MTKHIFIMIVLAGLLILADAFHEKELPLGTWTSLITFFILLGFWAATTFGKVMKELDE